MAPSYPVWPRPPLVTLACRSSCHRVRHPCLRDDRFDAKMQLAGI